MEIFWAPETLVYVAGAFYVLGLLILNQIMLRIMVLAGTAFYLIYYFTVSDQPLWEAIYISLMIGLANITGLIGLLARQSRLALPRAHKDIFHHFSGLPPGDFRTLMRAATRTKTVHEMALTIEDTHLDKLHYVIDGHTVVTKMGDRFTVPGQTFVGEVAYLTGAPASASTSLAAGSEFLTWSTADLQHICARSVRFQMAVEAVLSRDMANKVARSVAPYTALWRPELAQKATTSSAMQPVDQK
jgi:hypothetical protein